MPSDERSEPLFTKLLGLSFNQILLIRYRDIGLLVRNAADPSCPAPAWRSRSEISLRLSFSIGCRRTAASSNASGLPWLLRHLPRCSKTSNRPARAPEISPGYVISRRVCWLTIVTYSVKVLGRTTIVLPSREIVMLPSTCPILALTPRYAA